MTKRQFHTDVDLNFNELKNSKVENVNALPTASGDNLGRILYLYHNDRGYEGYYICRRNGMVYRWERLSTDAGTWETDFFVAEYAPDSLDTTPIGEYGDRTILDDFVPYLVLTTTGNSGSPIPEISSDGKRIAPVGQLRKNNLLHFASDGSWAPVVGITKAQYEETADNDLYLGDGSLYCNAGEFSPQQYWESIVSLVSNDPTVENPIQLYKKVNGELVEISHYRKPWETTDTAYTIVMACPYTIYVLDDVVGDSGKVWKGIFKTPTMWDGIDVGQYPLAPTGISPCPVTVVTENGVQKAKCYLYNYNAGGSQNAGAGTTNMFVKNRTYPQTGNISQISNVTRARNCNPDTTKPYPYAEGGFFARTAFIDAIELRMGTRDLTAIFGSGISSNDGCTNLSKYQDNGGFRYSSDNGTTWNYLNWNSSLPIYYGTKGSRRTTDVSNFVNNYYPKEECMESQIAASYACEINVHNSNSTICPFTLYGETYWFKDINNVNAKGFSANGMDCIVYKSISINYQGYASNDADTLTDYILECVLRMGLHGGVNLSGDIYDYCGGGLEMIGYITDSNKASGSFGVNVKMYAECDQTKWVNDTKTTIDDTEEFDAEKYYTYIGETTTTNNSYIKQRLGGTPMKISNASTLHQGVCGYVYNSNYFCNTANKKVRIGVRLRGSAHYSDCAPRFLNAHSSAASSPYAYGGSAQVLLDFGNE